MIPCIVNNFPLCKCMLPFTFEPVHTINFCNVNEWENAKKTPIFDKMVKIFHFCVHTTTLFSEYMLKKKCSQVK